MFTILIGEEGEYGLRLSKYLERHWRGPVRIFRFTAPETFLSSGESADCYLLGEAFVKKLSEEKASSERAAGESSDSGSGWSGEKTAAFKEKLLLLSDTEGEGRFCRYHAPGELLALLEARKPVPLADQGLPQGGSLVTAVYAPLFDASLKQVVAALMEPGDLYLGMEDVGNYCSEYGHMGDLCYYLGIEDKDILFRMAEIAVEEDGHWCVDSPNVFFELLDLQKEQYEQFFYTLRETDRYNHIYIGLGTGVFAHLKWGLPADRFILLDSRENERQHKACAYMEQVLQSGESPWKDRCERVFREDIAYGTIR